jgi:MarR family transcriptional regulator, lower aerobic nicotinate degradation pathway regulator
MPARSRRTHARAADELGIVDGLAQLSFLIQGTLQRRAAEHDLSMIQTRLLGVLRDRRPTMNELAQLLDLDKSSVSGLVDRAERRGFVVRAPSDADRRAVLVTLTATGRVLATDVAARFAADVTALLDGWPESDRAALAALASRVLVDHAREHGVDLLATDPVGHRALP